MIWDLNELEEIKCDLCGSFDKERIFTRADGLNVVECKSCGLCFVSPRPKRDLIDKMYDRKYFEKGANEYLGCGYENYFGYYNRNFLLQRWEFMLDLIFDITGKKKGKALEIGCATGELCYVLNKKGLEVLGLDISKSVILEAKRRYPNIEFSVGGIESLQEKGKFDYIFAFEVIEHVLSPMEFFKAVKMLLNEDGFFVLSTPNYDCGKKIGFEHWIGFNSSFEHLYYFNQKVLRMYGDKVGLSLIEWFTDDGGGAVQAQKKESFIKAFIKRILGKLNLLKFIRNVKQHLVRQKYEFYYTIKGDGNDIFVLFYNK